MKSMTANEEHTLSMLVRNQPGVLSRVAGVFSGRGYNISSLCVAETQDPKVSRITLTSCAERTFTDQIKKHLDKLIDVIAVEDYTGPSYASRELMLIGIRLRPESRDEFIRTAGTLGCRIISMNGNYFIIETTGTKDENEAVLRFFQPLGAEEMNRSGAIAIGRKGG
ncbi:MAG: acetolactate synthase small subunit [Smithellaceae bacterium]|nr:acetolactate synthase small subunit [Smithellaceae bacterium]